MIKKITHHHRRRLRRLSMMGLLLITQISHAQEPRIEEGWDLLSRYLYRDAAEVFVQVGSEQPRWRDLGLAASLLNEPPVTWGKIDQAVELLDGVIEGAENDAPALYARYLQARILHMHRDEAVAEIESAYRDVIARDHEGQVASLAASHLALLILYQRPELDVQERLAAADELESVAVNKTLPEVAVGYYRSLGDASLFYEQVTPEVLEWLKKAHEIGSSEALTQIGLSLQIAEVARALDEKETAVRYYREFLATAVPTDQRYNTARMRLEEMEVTR